MSYSIKILRLKTGKMPFHEWLSSITDRNVKARIQARLDRIATGNLGDHKSIGFGVSELRLAFGAVYRIYYGIDGHTLVILLTGGDKKSQNKDIRKAIEYWNEYKEEKE